MPKGQRDATPDQCRGDQSNATSSGPSLPVLSASFLLPLPDGRSSNGHCCSQTGTQHAKLNSGRETCRKLQGDAHAVGKYLGEFWPRHGAAVVNVCYCKNMQRLFSINNGAGGLQKF
jgi:hypothetical protein